MIKQIIVLFVAIVIALCAWAPWLEDSDVEAIVAKKYATLTGDIRDNAPLVGVTDTHKLVFGKETTLLYGGKWSSSNPDERFRGETVFVTFWGDVWGMKTAWDEPGE